MRQDEIFRLEMTVRSYECDTHGIVNNAVYLNYLEHARHEFLRRHLNWDLTILGIHGISLVPTSIDIEYLHSLKPNENFVIETRLERESDKYLIFPQNLYRANYKLVTAAKTIITAINSRTGKSEPLNSLENLLSGSCATR